MLIHYYTFHVHCPRQIIILGAGWIYFAVFFTLEVLGVKDGAVHLCQSFQVGIGKKPECTP